MPYLVCLEENEGRWIAHVPDLPGCFVERANREEVVQAVPKAVENYITWCEGHGLRISGLSEPMNVAEVIRAWESEDGYEVNAFFASDRPPLIEDELPQFERLLNATRVDLLGVVEGFDADDLSREFPGERWNIGGILMHVAHAEWWYLDRIGLAFSSAEMPDEPFAGLTKVREHLLAKLPEFVRRGGVVTLAGETWSARKVLRRALWHERDHTDHIKKLRDKLPQW
ncbi:MAG: type II toxin-antitoxin system HicB family antitoxin [Anaerolineaceae bacterium]|nr:MAG: type II toxin-antitoxin system HicB family antitoxin [Anaerolineaceae bacterium]